MEQVLPCNSAQASFFCLCKHWGLCSKSITTEFFINFTPCIFLAKPPNAERAKIHWVTARNSVLNFSGDERCPTVFSSIQKCPLKIKMMLLYILNTKFETPSRSFFHATFIPKGSLHGPSSQRAPKLYLSLLRCYLLLHLKKKKKKITLKKNDYFKSTNQEGLRRTDSWQHCSLQSFRSSELQPSLTDSYDPNQAQVKKHLS